MNTKLSILSWEEKVQEYIVPYYECRIVKQFKYLGSILTEKYKIEKKKYQKYYRETNASSLIKILGSLARSLPKVIKVQLYTTLLRLII